MILDHYLYHWEANYGLGQMQIYFEVETTSSEKSTPVDAHFLDGAAVVQMLNPRTANKQLPYWTISACVLPYMYLKSSTRADIIWDIHRTILTDRRWANVAEISCSLCIDSKELEGFPVRVDENNTELVRPKKIQ